MHKNKNENLSMLMAFTGNAIFGFSFLFSKLALDVAEPFVLLTVRFLTAYLLMTFLIVTGILPCHLKGKNIKPLILLGIFQPVLYFICESYGIKLTSSSFAGTIIALVPIAGVGLGAVFLKEKPTILQILFSLLSVGGVLVMATTDKVSGLSWQGFLFLLGAVVSGAMFSVHSRKIANSFTAIERTYVMFGVGSVAFALLGSFQVGSNLALWLTPLKNGGFWLSVLYLSCVSSIGAFLLLNKALDVLDVARSLVFANVTTVISVLAGVAILHEHFSGIQLVGILMVIIGVFGVNHYTK